MNDLEQLAKRIARDTHNLTGEDVLARREAIILGYLETLRLMPKDLQEHADEQDRAMGDRVTAAIIAGGVLVKCRCGHKNIDHAQPGPANPAFCLECDCDDFQRQP